MAQHLESALIANIEVKDDGVWERFLAAQTVLNSLYGFIERCECFNVLEPRCMGDAGSDPNVFGTVFDD
jgi:hypothetical protein